MLNLLKTLYRQWRCDHRWHWWRNIHGDEIIATGCRTVWCCARCDKFKYDQEYYTAEMAISIHKDAPK